MDKATLILAISLPLVALVALFAGGTLKYGDLSVGDVRLTQRVLGTEKVEEWIGRSVDIEDESGNPTIYEETLTVRNAGSGIFDAVVKSRQDGRNKRWAYKGYFAGEYLAISYKNWANDTGIGNLFLEKRKDLYVGRWIGRTCNSKLVVSCPYALVPAGMVEPSNLRDKLLGEPCYVLSVADGTQTQYALPTSCN